MCATVEYSDQTVPADYVCAHCKGTDCKLWREYQTFSPKLLCAMCAEADQGKKILEMDARGGMILEGDRFKMRCDQIGWYVPAVPTEDGLGYWGYSSVPQDGCEWWYALPNHPPSGKS